MLADARHATIRSALASLEEVQPGPPLDLASHSLRCFTAIACACDQCRTGLL